jgi:hypothetical protein
MKMMDTRILSVFLSLPNRAFFFFFTPVRSFASTYRWNEGRYSQWVYLLYGVGQEQIHTPAVVPMSTGWWVACAAAVASTNPWNQFFPVPSKQIKI